MKIKRYIVNNMSEAMNIIRFDLGREAVIISQRKIRKPGIMGFFSKKQIEVTAAVDNRKFEDTTAAATAIAKAANASAGAASSAMPTPTPMSAAAAATATATSTYNPMTAGTQASALQREPEYDVMREIQDMRNTINEIKDGAVKTTRKNRLQLRLESNDVGEGLIKKIFNITKGIRGEADEDTKLRKAIEKLVPISDEKLEGRVILVGPTGVGKTTTIAKLAGRLALTEKKKVGLLTVDTYRIGAVDQLKTYADILNLPFKVVLSIKDMEAAIESMKDCDVILIDTTGRSSKNSMQISELRAFVEKADPTSVHLVISCTTKEKDIEAITEGFRELNYNNVIITKLDETTTYGSILNILENAQKPLSFVTTGQNVPDDLMRINKSQASDLILKEFEQTSP